jgi:hypothetical protein
MRFSLVALVVCAVASLASASVTISSPTNGSSVSTSVHVASKSSSSSSITTTKVYVDGTSKYSVSSATVSTYLTLSSGSHKLTVQSWDSSGNVIKSSVDITVSSSSIPSTATKYRNIDQMTGWKSCDACAGASGSGPSAVVTLTQNLSSPSLDGKSAKFYLQGSTSYSNGLWWRQLGANDAVSHFVYDLYFYLKNPSAAQALEFDVNQGLNSKKYIFGTECDIKNNHVWKIYDAYNHKWMLTSIACSAPSAYAWNHLTLEFQRYNGHVKFVSITMNGKKSYLNKSYSPESSSSKELNVAVQIDGDKNNTAYSEYADKINLTAW